MYRSTELTKLVKDASVRFVVPDAALMEMCKSRENWETTIRRSLRILSSVPERTFVAKGNGEFMKMELDQGHPNTLADLASQDETIWFRELLVEVAEERHGHQFKTMATEICSANDMAQQQHLNHQKNLDSLKELIPTLREAYSEEFQRRLRAKLVDEYEYISIISHTATTVVDNESMSLRPGTMEFLIEHKSYVIRWLWLKVETVTAWLASGGFGTVAAKRITNSEIDRHYLAIGSYCDELLTKDHAMKNIDRMLRSALSSQLIGKIIDPATSTACSERATEQSVYGKKTPIPDQ